MARNSQDKAQQFNRQIVVSQRAVSEDALGTKGYTWVPFKTIYAKMIPIRGREIYAAGQLHATVTHIWRMRYRTDLDATMRVTYQGVHYDIVAPPDDVGGCHTITELQCVSNIGDGRPT